MLLTLLCLLFISWGLLCCLQGQGMTNEDAINRKQSLSLVLSLRSQEETRPFQWVTQTRAQARTRSSTSIMYQALFTYLTLRTPHLSSLWLENSHTDYPERFDTAEDMIMRHAYCQPWLQSTEQRNLVICECAKEFPFLLHFLFNATLFSFPRISRRWTMANVWNMNMTQRKPFPEVNMILSAQY